MKTKLWDGGFKPERAHDVDAGADIFAPERVVLRAHDSVVIDTKMGLQIPPGFFGKLESKSGLHVKEGIVCPGGVVDSGYTGSIVVRLENHGPRDHVFERGDKICQIIIQPCVSCTFEVVDELDEAERGASGFGSTGR